MALNAVYTNLDELTLRI